MNRLGSSALLAVALLAVLSPAAVGEASTVAPCGTVIDGDIGDDDLTYGGGGTGECTGGGSNSNGSAPTRSVRSVREEPSLCPGTPDARMEIIDIYDRATGALVDTVSRCVEPNIPGDPQPPPAPSALEVFERLPLPLPRVQTSPPGQGLVGFETWLWWGGDDTPPPVSVVVGEWAATVQPTLAAIEWDMGNGDRVIGNGPGREEQPSARYTYTTQCECTITMTLRWTGTVTLTHPLAPAPLVQQAPPVPFSGSAAYDVVEREAVVVG